MSKLIMPRYSIYEFHLPKHELGGCSLIVYEGEKALGARPALADLDKAVVAKVTGSGCYEDRQLNTRTAAATVSGATAAESLAWFAFRHLDVQELLRGDEARDMRALGEAMLQVTLDQLGGGRTLEEARNAAARSFLLGEVPLPESAVAEVMTSGLALDTVASQQATAL